MSREKFAVIGVGDFGGAIARTLAAKGAEVMAIDSSTEVIDSIANDVAYAVALDATDEKALISMGITDFDAVVVAIGESFEQRLLCTTLLLDLNVKRIIARSLGATQRKILEKIGITEILSPEDEVGIIVAERLLHPSIVSFLELPDDHKIAEIITPPKVANRSIGDLDIRDKYKLSLITIKRKYQLNGDKEFEHHILGVPDSKTIINPDDFLVIFGKDKDIDRFIEINY
jgi:trk system potassium uptake protein